MAQESYATADRSPVTPVRRSMRELRVKILREADEDPVAEVAKRHGISDVTIYAWRKRFGKLETVE
jgi:putative transposase